MKSEAIADDARRRQNDDAVRRLREESRLRQLLRRPGMSACILGTMVSLLLFLALEVRRQCLVAKAINAQVDAEWACANFDRRQQEIDAVRREQFAGAFDTAEVQRIEARAGAALETARRIAREQGCDSPASPEPPRVVNPKEKGRSRPTCKGIHPKPSRRHSELDELQ